MPAKLTLNLGDIDNRIQEGKQAGLERCAQTARDRLVENMEKPKHGRVYARRGHGATHVHVASAPGEAPANRTDRMIQSFKVDGATVYSDDPVTEYLEEGTARIEPRPNFATVENDMIREAPAIVAEEVAERLK